MTVDADRRSAPIDLADEAATRALGARLARALPADTAGWMILLQGELGSGKSTVARALIESLGHEGPVPSPTYTLVEPYETAGRLVYHVDLYRVSSEDELLFLGFQELADGLMLIEWPERVPGLAARADLTVELGYRGTARSARLIPRSPRGRALLETGGLASDQP